MLRIADTCLVHAQRLVGVVRPCAGARRRHRAVQPGAGLARPVAGAARSRGRTRRRRPRRGLARLPARRTRLLQPHAGRAAVAPRRRRLRRHAAALPDRCRLAGAAVAGPVSLARPGAGGHRRQGGEGNPLPPRACRRLGRAPGRRQRRVGARACRPRWPAPGRWWPSCSTTTRSMRRRPTAASARARVRCASPGWRVVEPLLRRRAARAAARHRVSQPRQTRQRTANTWATCWPRCSTCSAPFPAVCGERRGDCRRPRRPRLARARQRARPGSAGPVGRRPGHRARGVGGRRRRPGHRAHADLLRLPGHRSDRGRHPQRAGRRRPGPGAHHAAPVAAVDHRLARRRSAAQAAPTTASRRRAARRSCMCWRATSPARAAAARAPSACRPSAARRANRSTAASIAASRSSTSSRSERDERPALPPAARVARRRRHRRGAHRVVRRTRRAARRVRLPARPVPDAAPARRRPGPAPLVLDLRQPRRRRTARRRAPCRRRRILDLAARGSARGRHDRGAARRRASSSSRPATARRANCCWWPAGRASRR